MREPSRYLAVAEVDRVGIWLSATCAVHCLVMPLAIAVLPFFAIRREWTDLLECLFILASISLAAANLCWGVRIHKNRHLFLLFGAAAISIIAGRCLSKGPYEIILVTAGALGIAASHFLNRHLCLRCGHCEGHKF